MAWRVLPTKSLNEIFDPKKSPEALGLDVRHHRESQAKAIFDERVALIVVVFQRLVVDADSSQRGVADRVLNNRGMRRRDGDLHADLDLAAAAVDGVADDQGIGRAQ